jgi:transposase InsO family protein
LGIKHILARVNHPQTNGKLERFHGEIQRKQKWFESIDELIHWWNHIKPHMSLDWDNLETPKYERCQNQEQRLLMSKQERCMMSNNERRTDFGIAQSKV